MLNAYLTDDVILRRPSPPDADAGGDAAEPTDLLVRGRLMEKTRQTPNFADVAVATTHELWLAPLPLSGEETVLVAGRAFAIVRIEQVRDFDTVFLKVYLA